MNSGFYGLLKIQFSNVLNSLFGRSKKSKQRNFIPLLFPIAISLYLGFILTFVSADMFFGSDAYMVFVLASTMISFMILSFSLYQISGHLFKCVDYELLSSLPFTKMQIFISKLLSFYLYQYIYVFFVLIIPAYSYLVLNNGNILIVVLVYVLSTLIPMIPIIVAGVLGLIVSYISTFFRNKTIITIVLYVALLASLMFLPSLIGGNSSSVNVDASNLINSFKAIYPFMYYFGISIAKPNIVSIIIYILINLVPFIIFLLVFSNLYDYTNKKLRRTLKAKSSLIRTSDYNSNSLSMTLLKKEIRRYFQAPMYVLNTLIGPIMLVMAGVATLFIKPEQLLVLLEIPGSKVIILYVFVVISIFILAISSTTSSSISLEGKHIYFLKSLPLSAMNIFNAKILMNIIVAAPLSLIGAICMGIGLRVNLLEFASLIICIVVGIVFVAHVGILVNLKYPKFDWLNEMWVVKNSASVLITMICNAVVFIIVGFLVFQLDPIIKTSGVLLLSSLIVIILTSLMRLFLIKNGERIYSNL